jgi:hypothetical protein
VLAALGHEEPEHDAEQARAYVGALLFIEGLQELRAIRKLLTAPAKK